LCYSKNIVHKGTTYKASNKVNVIYNYCINRSTCLPKTLTNVIGVEISHARIEEQ